MRFESRTLRLGSGHVRFIFLTRNDHTRGARTSEDRYCESRKKAAILTLTLACIGLHDMPPALQIPIHRQTP
jgi:hypothetical protein